MSGLGGKVREGMAAFEACLGDYRTIYKSLARDISLGHTNYRLLLCQPCT